MYTAGLVYSNDKSTDSAEGGADASTSIASIAEQDLADAVLKLATKVNFNINTLNITTLL